MRIVIKRERERERERDLVDPKTDPEKFVQSSYITEQMKINWHHRNLQSAPIDTLAYIEIVSKYTPNIFEQLRFVYNISKRL